jgi:hypothetical protein
VKRVQRLTVLNAVLEKKSVKTEAGATITVTEKLLEQNQLLGEVGAAKTSLLRRLKERFFHYWSVLPNPNIEKTPAVSAGLQYLELSANVASSIPGAGPIKELLHLYKQHLTLTLESTKQ